MAAILDCRAIAADYFAWAARQALALKRKHCLAAVLFRPRQNPASLQYRDLILRDAARLGLLARAYEANGEKELLALLTKLNGDRRTTGIMVFYPLKAKLKDEDVMDFVAPHKDVEGLHALNLGYLLKFRQFLDEKKGIKCVVPATAKAVVKTLQHYPDIRIPGAFVTIINNSMRVGKPLGLMLENLGATVVKCYHMTPPAILENSVRRADILVTAVPSNSFKVDPSWVKPGSVVVDVSYEGNVDMAALAGRASFVTMADNGIGQVTRAMMFVNFIYCAHNAESSKSSAVASLG